VAVDAENPLRPVFVERWADQAALDAHVAVPGSREFVGSLQGLLDGEPTLSIHPVLEA
jgi:quinol monooxygenase YgiN